MVEDSVQQDASIFLKFGCRPFRVFLSTLPGSERYFIGNLVGVRDRLSPILWLG